ncbi:MAG: hypothetical protein M1812_007695 [Candelaria pacifica]|nr:MAG: hypothetical protein M1812_007695 [Candelaria pacifica]
MTTRTILKPSLRGIKRSVHFEPEQVSKYIRRNDYGDVKSQGSKFSGMDFTFDRPIELGKALSSRVQSYSGRVSPTYSPMEANFPIETETLAWAAENEILTIIPKSEYRIGLIFRAPHHEQHWNPRGSQVGDKGRTESCAGPICTKTRKMIVVAMYSDHYVAIPLYTHNGNGLTRKENADDYVSVFDHRYAADPLALQRLKPLSNRKALVTGIMYPQTRLIDEQSTAHFTYPVSRSYSLPINPEGQMSILSAFELVDLCSSAAVQLTPAMRLLRDELAMDQARAPDQCFI